MIGFGDAFLALNVIPQAATAGARPAGALQVGSRETCGRNSNSLYPRVVPRDATGATQFAPPSCEVRRRRVHKLSIQIRVTAGFRGRAQLQAVRVGKRRSPDVPASTPANQKRISGTHAGAARRGTVAFRTPFRGDLLLMSAAGAVCDRVHYPRDRRLGGRPDPRPVLRTALFP